MVADLDVPLKTDARYPRRFLRAEARNRRLGRPLQVMTLTRTRWGTAHVQRWGDRSQQRVLRRYFGHQAHDVGKLAL
ncbi:hypothetical protein [Mycobacterium sp. E3247]|uniref:hypothetical protein n=1 Tax=Mycobacterium sp. E3247 TaxID=1856864 RepID=UPI000801AFC3|nr:hypothetical protein [Mycobacterium sp. E3247]OBH09990.1 hypothetical protein A9X04_21205 [Mycobacterium sp. E3247]